MTDGKQGLHERLILSLGSDERMHEKIDAIYAERKEEFYYHYRTSRFYEHPAFDLYLTKQKQRMHKVTGILYEAVETGNFMDVHRIIKEGYNKLYRYLDKADKPGYERVLKLLTNGREMESVDEQEIINTFVVVLFLLQQFGKNMPLTAEFIMPYLGKAVQLQQDTLDTMAGIEKRNTFELTTFDKEQMRRFRVKEANYSISNILDWFIEEETKQKLEAMGKDYLGNAYEGTRSSVFRDGKHASLIGALSGLYKTQGISENILALKLEPYHLERFFFHFDRLFRENNLPDDLYDAVALTALFGFAVNMEYHDTRKNYLKPAEEETFAEMTLIREEMDKKEASWKREKAQLEHALALAREKNKSVAKNNDHLERENKRLKQDLADSKENEKELIALREFAFSLQQEEEPEKSPATVLSTPQLDACHVVVVGGHENWANKLREERPAFTFIHPDEKTISLSFLNRHNTVVFFNTTYNNHTIYERVMKEMRKNDNRLFYINERGSNTALLLAKMERMMKN